MSNRKINNKGLYIENQSISGGEVNNAVRDIHIYKTQSGVAINEFQSLLNQISSQIRTSSLPRGEREDIEAIITQVIKQSQKDEPKKNLLVDPLKTAFELIIQAGGAATATASIVQLLQKAISYAQNLF